MRTTISAVLFVALAAPLAACSSSVGTAASSSSSVSAADTASFCSSYCGRHAECDSSVDVQTCETECEDATATSFKRLRADVIEPTRTCFVESDCKSILSGKRLSECIEEAAVSVSPSAAAKSFCDAFASAAGRCDASVDRAKCLRLASIYSDETLGDAEKCTEKSCGTMGACIDAELDLGD